jgi:3-oxoacyl-[acyl-carrier protein] reductase
MKFKNKVVLVTGSSRGIGRATALLFAKEGAKLIINYSKSEKEANQVVQEINKISEAISIKCDVSNEEHVKKMFQEILLKFGRLDILVNNAGKYIDGDEWNGNSKIWEETLRNNLISVMNTSKYAAEIFIKQKSGIIINIASRYSVSGQFDSLAYSASKAGIVNITQSFAKLLSPFGRANCISPGPVRAGYWLRAPKEELDALLKHYKRLLEPEEIAEKVIFLTSNESLGINGQNILMNNEELGN